MKKFALFLILFLAVTLLLSGVITLSVYWRDAEDRATRWQNVAAGWKQVADTWEAVARLSETRAELWKACALTLEADKADRPSRPSVQTALGFGDSPDPSLKPSVQSLPAVP